MTARSRPAERLLQNQSAEKTDHRMRPQSHPVALALVALAGLSNSWGTGIGLGIGIASGLVATSVLAPPAVAQSRTAAAKEAQTITVLIEGATPGLRCADAA